MIRRTLSFSLVIILVAASLAPSYARADEVIVLPPQKRERHPTPFKHTKEYFSLLALDLDGDGVEMKLARDENLFLWNTKSDDFSRVCGWVKPDDGVLAYDANEGGLISDSGDLFGTIEQDGFTILRQHDSDGNGYIDAHDPIWNRLVIWRNLDYDAFSQSTEITPLSKSDITSINLTTQPADQMIADSRMTLTSSYLYKGARTDSKRMIANIRVACDLENTRFIGRRVLDPDTYRLPALRGYGLIPDLSDAMSLDHQGPDNLKSQVQYLHEKTFMDFLDPQQNLNDVFLNMLLRWGRVDQINPASRGPNIDARKLAFTEKTLDNPFEQVHWNNTPNPLFWASKDLHEAFLLLYNHHYGSFLYSMNGAPLYYNEMLHLQYVKDIKQYIATMETPEDRAYAWENVIRFLNYTVGIRKMPVTDIVELKAAIYASAPELTLEKLLKHIESPHPRTLPGSSYGYRILDAKTVEKSTLLELFQEARRRDSSHAVVISDVVTSKLQECCRDKEAFIEELQKNGFNISDSTARTKQDMLYKEPDYFSQKQYNLYMVGLRKFSLLDRFKISLALPYDTYYIMGVFKDDKLDWAYADVKRYNAKY